MSDLPTPSTAVIVVPTYNEAANIVELLTALRSHSPDAHVLVVDDASPDGTGRLAQAFADTDPGVRVLHRGAKNGLGAAYRDAFQRVIAQGYGVIVTMDSDFSHDPALVADLVAAVDEGADAAIGSRYVPGGGTVDWPLHRRLLSRWGNRYTATVLRIPVRDCTSGFRAYRTSALAAIDPAATAAEGYAFLTELVRRLASRDARLVEIPITFRDRTRGQSKMSGRIVVESMLRVTTWAARDLVARRRP